jgi:hypothetical protein
MQDGSDGEGFEIDSVSNIGGKVGDGCLAHQPGTHDVVVGVVVVVCTGVGNRSSDCRGVRYGNAGNDASECMCK